MQEWDDVPLLHMCTCIKLFYFGNYSAMKENYPKIGVRRGRTPPAHTNFGTFTLRRL
jgi:hypothetical protein